MVSGCFDFEVQGFSGLRVQGIGIQDRGARLQHLGPRTQPIAQAPRSKTCRPNTEALINRIGC